MSGDFPGRGTGGWPKLLDFNLGCVKTALQSGSLEPRAWTIQGLVGREKMGEYCHLEVLVVLLGACCSESLAPNTESG